MPKMETPVELADKFADMLGIYCDHPEETFEEHEGGTVCRIDWCIEMADRIRAAAANEKKLEPKPETAEHVVMEVWEVGDDRDSRPRVVLRGTGEDGGRESVKKFAPHVYGKVDLWVGGSVPD